jgi:hypothetical protein
MNVVRAVSSEGAGRLAYYTRVRALLDSDPMVRRYFERQSSDLPAFYGDQVRRDLGSLWEWLPAGALSHDPNAYLASEEASAASAPPPESISATAS